MVESNERSNAVFRALADPSRRQIIDTLSRGDRTVGELARPLDMTLAGASKHVSVLENAGLLVRRKEGRERICSLKPQGLFAVRDWVQHYSAFWEARLDALDKAMKEAGDE